MNSNNQSYDISSINNNAANETELVEVNPNNLTGKDSGYSTLNSNENEIASSTEYTENNDVNEDFKDLKEQFNNSKIINNPLVNNESRKKIKYRKGNLHTFFYGKNGLPKIVIGPDCKYDTFYFNINRGICIMYAIIYCRINFIILYRVMEIFTYHFKIIWNFSLFILCNNIHFNLYNGSRSYSS